MRIVVAENYANLRWIIADRLRQDGHEVAEIADGTALLALLAREKPELLLCDLRLLGASGFDVLRLHGRTVPVLLMTGIPVAEIHAEAMRLGALAVLQKPFAVEELLAFIRASDPRNG